MRTIWWLITTVGAGAALAVAAAAVNYVPLALDEVGEARADRSGWAQAAEFASLILDSGWAWAALAVAAGWLISASLRPAVAAAVGAAGGAVALIAATLVYYLAEWLLLDQPLTMGFVSRYWFTASVLLGLPLGAIGATIRRPGLAGVLAALVVPAGAVINMVVLPPPAESLMATPVRLTVWVCAAVAVVVLLVRATPGHAPGSAEPAIRVT